MGNKALNEAADVVDSRKAFIEPLADIMGDQYVSYAQQICNKDVCHKTGNRKWWQSTGLAIEK